MVKKDLADMREDYNSEGINKAGVSPDPFDQFDVWFNKYLALGLEVPNAMTLSTCGKDNRPASRIVLLKSFDNNGFVFYTDYSSKKGNDLLVNPYASLLFYWQELQRQVRIEGRVEKITREGSGEYFHSRPRESQIAAFVSHQSETITNRDDLLQRYEDTAKKYEGKEIPLPEDWGGYHLMPDEFEFWEGRKNRLHDRIQYLLEKDNWIIRRLSP